MTLADDRDLSSRVEVWVDGELWQSITGFDQAGPNDKVYVLEPESGTIRFGDGIQGRRPPGGSSVRVSYRQGPELGGSSPLQRVRYFSGQLLSADDLQTEQDYFREQHRRHNRDLHGYGIVQGLELSVAGGTVRVAPGVAIDRRGEQVAVPQPVTLRVPAGSSSWYVTLAFAECETDPVPTPGAEALQNTRVQEGYRIAFESTLPDDTIALGRLVCGPEGWALAQEFKLLRLR